MSESPFQAPELEAMNALLPAYEFGQILAANPAGAVYYAIQKSLDRYVALKLFSPVLGQDEIFMDSFVRSNSLVAGLRHPHLITVYDTGVVEGMPFVVMEFVQGKSLLRSMRAGAVELNLAAALTGQICEGLAHAHERGLVHGQLDPMSILINQNPAPKIGNFALCGAVHTLPEIEPSAHYQAPEVRAGQDPIPASDVYSIAVIFYELITGSAFTEDGPPASAMVQVPRGLDGVIQQALASDPVLRTADPLQFFSQLQQVMDSGPRKVNLATAGGGLSHHPRSLTATGWKAPVRPRR